MNIKLCMLIFIPLKVNNYLTFINYKEINYKNIILYIYRKF